MELHSTLLTLNVVTVEFPSQRASNGYLYVFLDVSLNQLLNQQWSLIWFELPNFHVRSLKCYVFDIIYTLHRMIYQECQTNLYAIYISVKI